MKGIFSLDGWFVKYGSKLWDLFWLNILTVICCIPIVTISTSFSAMHYVLLKIWRDEDHGITRAFFHSFFQNLKQNVPIQLLFLVVTYLLCVTTMLLWKNGGGMLLFLVAVVAVMLLCVWLWVIILQSRYSNTVTNTFLHAMAASLAHPGRTLIMALAFLAPFFLLLFSYKVIVIILSIGLTVPGILQTYLYNDIFKEMEPKEETEIISE